MSGAQRAAWAALAELATRMADPSRPEDVPQTGWAHFPEWDQLLGLAVRLAPRSSELLDASAQFAQAALALDDAPQEDACT